MKKKSTGQRRFRSSLGKGGQAYEDGSGRPIRAGHRVRRTLRNDHGRRRPWDFAECEFPLNHSQGLCRRGVLGFCAAPSGHKCTSRTVTDPAPYGGDGMEAARAQSLQRAMMTSAWIYPTRSCGSRRFGATGGGSSSRRSQTELQWRPIVGSGRAHTNKID